MFVGDHPRAVGGLENKCSSRKLRFCPQCPGKGSPAQPPSNRIPNRPNYCDQKAAAAGEHPPGRVLGFGSSWVQEGMNQRCFRPECYRRAVPLLQKGSLPHRNTGYSWLPRGATSCPQLKNHRVTQGFSNQENNLVHARNEPRNHSKTQQSCVNRSILPRPLTGLALVQVFGKLQRMNFEFRALRAKRKSISLIILLIPRREARWSQGRSVALIKL